VTSTGCESSIFFGLRIFYRLADPKQATRKRLFEFLQDAYKSEEQLHEDTARLKEAIRDGSCTVSEWKPYSAISNARTAQGKRI